MDGMFLVCNLVMGLCAAGAAWFGAGAYRQIVDWIEGDLSERWRTLRTPTRGVRRGIHAWLAAVTTILFVLWLGFDAPTLGFCLGLLLSAGPWYWVRRMGQRRRQRIEDQLADAMVVFSSAIRAGLSIPQALEILATECPLPIKQEFAQLVGEYKMGKPLERALEEGKERLRSENFVLFAAALLASRESGGRLNETVERISRSIVELQRLTRKVMSETAHARKSAVYMALAPLLILVVYFFVDPINTELLFTSLPGQLMLSASVILNVVAYVWARQILSPDI